MSDVFNRYIGKDCVIYLSNTGSNIIECTVNFISDNSESWEVFANSKTFKDSVSAYEYESSLFDELRAVDEEEKFSVFKHWLEEQEDLWEYEIEDKKEAKSLFEYSKMSNEDNWKEVLKRITKDW